MSRMRLGIGRACLIVGLFPAVVARTRAATAEWNVARSAHFAVKSQGAPTAAIDEVIRYAEKDYDEVTRALGVRRYDNFWTWDNRASIYVLPDRQAYEAFIGEASRSGARADVVRREIATFVGMRGFFESILVHEIGHIVFREYVGFEKKLPLWLDEGVATYLEKKHKGERMGIVKAILDGPQFMTVADLSAAGKGKEAAPALFYAEACSIMAFLIDARGAERFAQFCSGLRRMPADGEWTEVLRRTYGYKGLDELNDAWVKHLRSAAAGRTE